eukprot:15875344-Heterocapsa_arctica.AAC.1
MVLTRTPGFESRKSNCATPAKMFPGLCPKRQPSCEANWVYTHTYTCNCVRELGSKPSSRT